MSTAYRESFCIDADHPALPGHFPGRPLVPGVLLLEQVALALARWRGQRLARLVEAKFAAPLRPGEEATVELHEAGARVRFAVLRGGTLLARGQIEGAR
ncbi:3-hydroxymyristoyl/3-hydroxydecanoyl-(acylcarrier protein) dehydratase [Mizugakiibacter sediminis]|uniref:3-hydroxymyristoyl/3-hydroxydecanoyl-(Acylcarrier protein) dehydratase n=1 Tax=Mizugakiibacter sediminis TaxID=1475481 RepID=A0A0K8QJ51_9GAMM|nr:hydroxymyristoyl-ACP dehydratase [Mizugakiibacter sediminis]GAP64878.1 3-hydroxymyristoyl/3-hydroxydecanoyl-(acylcarrier protein) dehydratase [Mizugakiibacter sediminis]